MKRILSLFLAALLTSGVLFSCGGTEAAETKTETKAVGEKTISSETDPAAEAPVTTDYSLITENGEARARIVLSANASDSEIFAAEELRYHIALVSGAEVSVVNEADESTLSIVIGTPDSVPALETLFPEDLAWLRDLGEEGGDTRWGSDGFAVRKTDTALYIFGAEARGALNGVYDFIEENLGVIWVRADEEAGTFYDAMSTITVTKADYKEKSPFDLRALIFYGRADPNDTDGSTVYNTEKLFSRNKINSIKTSFWETEKLAWHDSVGLGSFISDHNIKSLVTSSPLYDPAIDEYWETDKDGNHLTPEESLQVNIWSDLTVEAVAATVISVLDNSPTPLEHFGICLQDTLTHGVFPEMTEPFEYAPGEFVNPTDKDYYSTVFFTFLNKVAAKVGTVHPEVAIHIKRQPGRA